MSRHILNCVLLADLFAEGRSLADIGSGAGLPGLVLAIARPDLKIALIEPLQRRCRWLDMVAQDLNLDVEILNLRAEQVAERKFDYVTARAVARIDKLSRLVKPLLKKGGELIALKGERAESELATHLAAVKKMGYENPKVQVLAADTQFQTFVIKSRLK